MFIEIMVAAVLIGGIGSGEEGDDAEFTGHAKLRPVAQSPTKDVSSTVATTAIAKTTEQFHQLGIGYANLGQVESLAESLRSSQAPSETPEEKIAESKEAKDWKGFEPSLYRGVHFSAQWRNVRECIMYRESRFNYRGRSSISTAAGAYQFLDSQWRESLTHMMIQESREANDGLIPEIKELRDKPIQKWNRYFQDRAFYTAWDNGNGKSHWDLTRHNC